MANDPGPNFKINTQMVLVSFQGWKRALSKHIIQSLTERSENMLPSPNLQCCTQLEISLMGERLSNKDKNIDDPRKSNINTFTQNSGVKENTAELSDRKPAGI